MLADFRGHFSNSSSRQLVIYTTSSIVRRPHRAPWYPEACPASQPAGPVRPTRTYSVHRWEGIMQNAPQVRYLRTNNGGRLSSRVMQGSLADEREGRASNHFRPMASRGTY
jgi:hypothetical protein